MTPEIQKRLDNDYTYHAPSDVQKAKYETLRAQAKLLAETIAELTPASREQSAALTHLDAVVFFANAAIARNP